MSDTDQPINPEDAWAHAMRTQPAEPTFVAPTGLTLRGLIEALTALERQGYGDRRVQISVPIDPDDCKHIVVEANLAFAGWAIPDLGAIDKADGDEQNAEVRAAGEPEGIWPDEDLAVIIHGFQPCPADLDNLKRNWSTR